MDLDENQEMEKIFLSGRIQLKINNNNIENVKAKMSHRDHKTNRSGC